MTMNRRRNPASHNHASKVFLVICFVAFTSSAQNPPNNGKESGLIERVSHNRLHPEFGIGLAEAAEFKVISRKAKFRIGELISVDLAIMNKLESPTYFIKLEKLARIWVASRKNEPVGIRLYGIPEFAFSLRDFSLLSPGQFDSASFLFELGCQTTEEKEGERNLRALFDSNSFANRGRGCIDIRTPGLYRLDARMNNDYVVVGKVSGAKTAVGESKATPFFIEVE